MNECIILTGGGTAGHVSPNINLIPELKKRFKKIYYIGSKNGIEKTLIKSRTDIQYFSISTTKLHRHKIFKNFLLPINFIKSICEARKIIKKLKPSIVFSKGGYVGLPVVIAAHKQNIPVICHESDITMGLANKLAKNYSKKICTSFEITAKQNGKKCIYTGMPLKLSKLTKLEAKGKLGISTNKPILLITGGSLGAEFINKIIFENIKILLNDFYIIHLTGKGNLNSNIINSGYKQIEFSNDMWTIFRATDFAISRAGSNTIIELLSNEIPTIFIPLPKGNSRGDQIENAKYIESLGCSKTIFQSEYNFKKLQNYLKYLQNNSQKLKNSIKKLKIVDGTENIINVILENKNT